jgi:hypothetical protein
MGLMRKLTSVSTGGAVKDTSRREAQTKAAPAEARLANEQAGSGRAGRKAEEQAAAQRQAEGEPRYREPTPGAAVRSAGHEEADRQDGEDIPRQLVQLGRLHRVGLLTDAEYEDKRARLVEKL